MKPIQIDKSKKYYEPCEGTYYHLFPTPFFHGKLRLNHLEVKRDIDIIIDEVEKRYPEDGKRNYTSYFDGDLQEKMVNSAWYNDFANQIKDSYIEYCCTQFECPVDHLSRHDIHLFAWVNRYDGLTTHSTHDHVNSLVSGTYYVDMGPNAEPICFQSPGQTTTFSHRTNNRDIEISEQMRVAGAPGTHNEMRFHGRNGDFLLWPSYVLHSVDRSYEPNDNYKRYGISFNLYHNIIINHNESGDNMSYSFKEQKR